MANDLTNGVFNNLYEHPRMQELCTQQIRELSALTAKQAQDRIRLAFDIRDEMDEVS